MRLAFVEICVLSASSPQVSRRLLAALARFAATLPEARLLDIVADAGAAAAAQRCRRVYVEPDSMGLA